MSRYGAYLDRINALSKKYKSKVRVFSLHQFKNRLNMNLDKSKYGSASRLYFQRFLNGAISQSYKTKMILGSLKRDQLIRKWDKQQGYLIYTNKFSKRKFNNYGYKNRTTKNVSFRKLNNRFPKRNIFGSSAGKKPIYMSRFQKR